MFHHIGQSALVDTLEAAPGYSSGFEEREEWVSMKRWLAWGLCASALLGCGDRDAPPMKRMDGMRPVAPVRPAAPAASPEEAPAQMLGGARPIPATPTEITGAEVGAEGDAVTSPDAGSEKAPPEAQLLRVYHAVVCHRRRASSPPRCPPCIHAAPRKIPMTLARRGRRFSAAPVSPRGSFRRRRRYNAP